MNIFNLDNFSSIELPVSHIALKEAAREQKWKQDWLLEYAGERVEDPVGPRFEEANGIRNTVETYRASNSKSD